MITEFLSDNEIITVAMNLEEEGMSFYDEAAKLSRHKESRDIFMKLRDEEKEHYGTFKEILGGLGGADSKAYFDIDDQTRAYLKSLVETGVFKTIDRKTIKKMDEITALETALNVERDSILFYKAAKASSVNKKAGQIMSKIIVIEKTHLIMLSNRLRVARKLF